MSDLPGPGDYASPDELDEHSEPAYRCSSCGWTGDEPLEDSEELSDSGLVAARPVLLCPECECVARPNVDSDGYSRRMRDEIRECNESIVDLERALTELVSRRDELVAGLRATTGLTS